MKIIEYFFTAHARDRMRQRYISAEEVRLALDKPDLSYPGTKGDMSYIKSINGRQIRVVTVGEELRKIITVIVVGQPGESK